MMRLFINFFALLTIALAVTSCGNKSDSNNNPIVTPFRGYWTIHNEHDHLNFADVRIDGSAITVYGHLPKGSPYLKKIEEKDAYKGAINLEREVLEGNFSIDNKRDAKLPNGDWTFADFKIEWKLSSCVGVKPVLKKVTLPVGFLITAKDDKENQLSHFFWGAPTDPNHIQLWRYNDNDAIPDTWGKVKAVVPGCYKDDGQFVPNAVSGTVP